MRTAIDRMMRGGYGHRERWQGYHESGRSCAARAMLSAWAPAAHSEFPLTLSVPAEPRANPVQLKRW